MKYTLLLLVAFVGSSANVLAQSMLQIQSRSSNGRVAYFSAAGSGCTQTQWDLAHDAASGTGANYGTATRADFAMSGCGPNTSVTIARGFLVFDTSVIPDTTVITSATLNLYVTAKRNGINDAHDFLTVVASTQNNLDFLLRDDYTHAGTTEGSNRLDITDIATGAYNTWSLNATGLSWIDTTGYTYLAVREGHDLLDIWPGYSIDEINAIDIAMLAAGPTQAPYLEVTYTASDSTAPTVTIIHPTNLASVAGTNALIASASDDQVLAGVQFKIDGENIGAEDISPPYALAWDTTTVSDGAYTITAVARDAAGNAAESDGVSVTVNNTHPPPEGLGCPGFRIEGFGKNTIGGCGGTVYTVTNLNDNGAGSLRSFLNLSGPRIIKFNVSGTIQLLSDLGINEPYLTIDGSDAPNGGVQISGGSIVLNSTAHDVILRHIRVRPGTTVRVPDSGDAVRSTGAVNVVLDHVSLEFSTDELIGGYGSNFTIQHCILAWPLHCTGLRSDGECHAKSLFVTFGGAWTIHHNLIAHSDDRNPVLLTDFTEFVNNVLYNYNATPKYGGGAQCSNAVGNYFKHATNTQYEFGLESQLPNFQLYVSGNIGPHRPDDTYPENAVVEPAYRGNVVESPPFPLGVQPSASAAAAYIEVLAGAGATLPCRDGLDQLVVASVLDGTGRIIDHPSEVGGYPDLTATCGGCSTPSNIAPRVVAKPNQLVP